MVNLSACVIVKNEEENLFKWLSCMKKIANEMIIVDTGSVDKSISIAESAGGKVYSYKWNNDFAAAKNFAIDHAQGEWILFLDADEYFAEDCINKIPKYIEEIHGNKSIDALLCRLINIDNDKADSCISVIQSLRIFRRDKALRFKGKIHEFLARADGPLRISKMDNDIEIYHTGYSSSIIKKKLERNLKLLQMDILKNGEKATYYPYLTDCYYGLKEYEKAIYYARKSIEENIISIGQESTIYRRLIDSLVLSGKDVDEVLPIIEIANAKFPQMPEFIWNKGEMFFQQKKYAEAEMFLKKAVDMYQNNNMMSDCGGTFAGQVNLVYCRMGEIAVLKNDILQALEMYVKSLKIYRYNPIALKGLCWQLRYQDPVDVIVLLKSIYNDSRHDLDFISKTLKEWWWNSVNIYYSKQLGEKYKVSVEDFSLAAFCAAKNYKNALDYATKSVYDIYKFVIMTIIYKYNENFYKTSMILLPEIYQNVIDKFLGKSIKLNKFEDKIYNEIKEELSRIEI